MANVWFNVSAEFRDSICWSIASYKSKKVKQVFAYLKQKEIKIKRKNGCLLYNL
jgi:hypothetical protein